MAFSLVIERAMGMDFDACSGKKDEMAGTLVGMMLVAF